MSQLAELGAAHGRFQILHLQHLEYILDAHKRCHHLLVGITQYERRQPAQGPSPQHRFSELDNPLTYFERAQLLQSVLDGEGVARDTYTVTPFPIDQPTLLKEFIPPSTICYTTLCDHWNHDKISILEHHGYHVEILRKREPDRLQGRAIRELIRNGDPKWRELVPDATAQYLASHRLLKRIAEGVG
jgi:nicotinamide mononucleotide adenylyltransferase